MLSHMKLAAASLLAIQLAWLEPANAQEPKTRDYVVTIYKAAPGQQVALLRWMAEEERRSAAIQFRREL
jgi:hypothetical protein